MNPNKNIQIQNTDEEFYSHTHWLVETLNRTAEFIEFCQPVAPTMTEEIRLKCLETADRAMAIARMQAERERIGFRLLPLTEYLKQLADSANTSLESIWAGFGQQEISEIAAGTVRTFSLLAREIGQSLEETLLQVRLEFAQANGCGGLIAATAKRRASDGLPDYQSEQFRQALEKIEADYSSKQGKQISHLTEEVRAAFKMDA